jgi:hypothetical protein
MLLLLAEPDQPLDALAFDLHAEKGTRLAGVTCLEICNDSRFHAVDCCHAARRKKSHVYEHTAGLALLVGRCK